jgi:hypothetical protein
MGVTRVLVVADDRAIPRQSKLARPDHRHLALVSPSTLEESTKRRPG